eukprot:6309162-Prorocentrum_lima.AAC.1
MLKPRLARWSLCSSGLWVAERDVAFICLMCARDSTPFGEAEENRSFWEWARHAFGEEGMLCEC